MAENGDAARAPWQPAVSDGRVEDAPLGEWVGQALGTASRCWKGPAGTGVFDDVTCAWVLDGLMAHLNEVIDGVIAGAAAAVRPAGCRVTPAMRAVLDEAAGREHSADGAVVRALERCLALAGIDVADEATGEVAPPGEPCGNARAHYGPHPWLDQAPPPGVGMVQRQCAGRPVTTAAFADHRYVDVLRCYQGDEAGPCPAMLVVEQSDGLAVPGDMHGWTVREGPGSGFGAGREWRCPRHG